MIIKEVYIKNFGKFSEQHFQFDTGVHIIYGENEFGKSTLVAFIRAMLFGMERGRGKAAAKDDFSRYEPWDNPNYYAGSMRFSCGGRTFLLERSFDRYTKHASLVCEDDGEELSVEQGDLEMLLGGITPLMYDNTVLVRQMSARPGQELSDSLKNYAANYYETGGGEVDLQGAMKHLKEKQKETERQLRLLDEEQENKRGKIRQECSYITQDMERLRQEFEENQQQYSESVREEARLRAQYEKEEKRQEKPKDTEETPGLYEKKSRTFLSAGIVGVLIGIAGIFWGKILARQDWFSGRVPLQLIGYLILAAGLILLCVGIVKRTAERRAFRAWKKQTVRNMKYESTDNEAECRRLAQEIRQAEENKKKQVWQREKLQSEWKEKEVRLENLHEEERESEISEERLLIEEDLKALKMAAETMEAAAKRLGRGTDERINDKASEILGAVTGGRYCRLQMSDNMDISVWDGQRRISLHCLSRGTIEQIYFAIRMASAELLGEEELPVILDDMFVFYDEKRLKSALKWLSDTKKQAIIFTCQRREAEIMEGRI